MGVYLYPSGTETELKNAYIGKVIEKSVDLRGKTLADLQALWWTWVYSNWTYTWDSNWLTLPSSSSSSAGDKHIIVYYYADGITSNSKIKLHATGYCARTYSNHSYMYNSAMFIWLYNSYDGDRGTWFWGGYNASSASATWLIPWISLNASIIWTQMSWNVGGDVDMTVEIDFPNKTAKYTTTSPISQTTTSTLTDSQIETILAYKYVVFNVYKSDKSVVTSLYTTSFSIE